MCCLFSWFFAVISILMVFVIMGSNIPEVERKADEKVGAWETHLELLKNPIVILFFMCIFTYVGTEQGIANWISVFLKQYHEYDPLTNGARTVSWF